MRPITFLLLIPAALTLVVGRALSDRDGDAASSTTAFAIDGRTFRVEEPAGDELSLVARELKTRGIDTRDISDHLSSVIRSGPVEALSETAGKARPPILPRGLEPDHFLRLESGTGPVDIAFGRVACGEKDLVTRLGSSGWTIRETGINGASGIVAQLTKGKETSFVLLEKAEGRFLAIRRAVR